MDGGSRYTSELFRASQNFSDTLPDLSPEAVLRLAREAIARRKADVEKASKDAEGRDYRIAVHAYLYSARLSPEEQEGRLRRVMEIMRKDPGAVHANEPDTDRLILSIDNRLASAKNKIAPALLHEASELIVSLKIRTPENKSLPPQACRQKLRVRSAASAIFAIAAGSKTFPEMVALSHRIDDLYQGLEKIHEPGRLLAAKESIIGLLRQTRAHFGQTHQLVQMPLVCAFSALSRPGGDPEIEAEIEQTLSFMQQLNPKTFANFRRLRYQVNHEPRAA